MNSFGFSVPQDIIFGEGSIKRLPELLKKCGAKKILIISGPHLKKMGVVKKIADMTAAEGIECGDFCDVEGNPSTETVEKAAECYKQMGAEAIIALGGGSPMDVAKAVGVLVKFGGKITEYEGGGKVPDEIVPLIAIPTTAGTGSEVTAFSVITDHSRNYKLTVFSYYLIPKYAILDPELLYSLPASVAAATGIDALVHAMESYVSRAASPFSEAMSEKAMELIGGNIRRFVACREDKEAAAAMLAGSMFAGIAFAWARLGDVHAMAHPLSAYYGIAHGVANAVLLPVVAEYNALADNGKYRKIYDYISLVKSDDSFEPSMLASCIRSLTASLGIPKGLAELGVEEEKFTAMAEDAMKSGNIAVNPRATKLEDIMEMFAKAM